MRAAASLLMWLIALPAYVVGILDAGRLAGMTAAVIFLVIISLASLWFARRISTDRGFGVYSLTVNALEVLGYTAIIHFAGGLEAAFLTLIYAALISYVGVVAPVRHPYIVAGMCAAAFSGVVVFEKVGILNSYSPFARDATVLSWAQVVVIVAAIAALFFMVAFLAARNSMKLKRSREQLQEQKYHLEQKALERTAELREANESLWKEINSRRDLEKSLRYSRESFRRLLDGISDVLFSHDFDGRLLTVNRSAVDLLGHPPEELIGRSITDFIPARHRKGFVETYLPAVRRKGEADGVVILEDKDGNQHTLEYRNRLVEEEQVPPCISGVGRDITARVQAEREVKDLQQHLFQAQKLQAVGTLASGIAHDFNNVLQAVTGYVTLLRDFDGGVLTKDQILSEIDHSTERAAELVRRLLTFARGAHTSLQPLDLNREVAHAVQILERILPKMIFIDLQLHDKELMIDGDPTLIEQIVMNLGTNARDAMPDGGRLSITLTEVIPEASRRDEEEGRAHRRCASLVISDTGFGMNDETISHIFEPFFTTKGPDEGTGLGLSTVYGIVNAHGGSIQCTSKPEQGTKISIEMPFREEDGAGSELIEETVVAEGRGHATVLVVDDEWPIVDVAQRVLEHAGFQTMTASSGEEAIDSYRVHRDEIDVVVLDLGMPGIGGLACLEDLMTMDPELPVLIASGYSGDGDVERTRAAGAAGFVAKPYRVNELVDEVRRILDTSTRKA